MAVLDLPDPMQTPPTVKTGATDDLLSQLAGDEIDRMLAEAEVETAGNGFDEPSRPSTEFIASPPDFSVPPGSAVAALKAPVGASELSHEPIEVPSPSELTGPPSTKHATEAAPSIRNSASPANEVAAPIEMGALLDTLSTTSARMDPPSSDVANFVATASASAPVTVVPVPMDSAAIIAAELETSEAERRALSGAIEPVVATDPGIDPHAFDVDPSQADESSDALPFFLRPLEWLNAPFAESGEGTREAIGKIALLTLVNAVGVLVYVFFFRRR